MCNDTLTCVCLVILFYFEVDNLTEKTHHFSCCCPINVDGNCSQLKHLNASVFAVLTKKAEFSELSCSHSCSCSKIV